MDSSRIGLFGRGCVVAILAACAGCSSSSNPATGDAGGSSSGGSSSGGSSSGAGPSDGGTPVKDGGGMACTKTYPVSVGTLITATVSWPQTAAVAAGSGPYYLWLLTTYSADASGSIKGTTTTCGTAPAIVTLSALGDMAENVPSGQTGQVKPVYPPDSFTATPPTDITGTLGGTNVGSSFEVDPNVTLQGLKPDDPLSDPTKAWPQSQSAFTAGELTYADGGVYVDPMGHPGIHAVFDGTPPYYLSTTSLSMDSPRASDFWSVNRVQLGLYGTSTSCTETTGTAFVTLINNRIVGCELANDAGRCTSDQYGFIDSNTTQYKPTNGTFDSKELMAGQTCTDVLAMFPMPTK